MLFRSPPDYFENKFTFILPHLHLFYYMQITSFFIIGLNVNTHITFEEPGGYPGPSVWDDAINTYCASFLLFMKKYTAIGRAIISNKISTIDIANICEPVGFCTFVGVSSGVTCFSSIIGSSV